MIVIITFTISQLISHHSRKRELRRSWYFKAYFDSSFNKINDFFKECDYVVKKSLKKLEQFEDDNLKEDYISKKLEKIADLHRKFLIQVLMPLKGAYPKTFTHLDFILESFYDVHSDVFDKSKMDVKKAHEDYAKNIETIKSNLLTFLSIPVLKNNESSRLIRQLQRHNPLNQKRNYGKVFSCIIALFVVAFLTDIARPKGQYNPDIIKKKVALEYVENHISLKLLSPSTAVFKKVVDEDIYIDEENKLRFSTHVDSQNQYGATIREYFTCIIKFNMDNKIVSCVFLNSPKH